jgi:glycosyltransferase involved in cell wall biosynthesis
MRIAFIGQKGLEIGERGGGVEQHVAALSKGLAARGNEVTVYARKRYQPATPAPEVPGVSVRFVPTLYRKNAEAIVHVVLCTIDALRRPYDIVHYQGVGPATLAWIPRLFKKSCRVVVTFHSQDRFHKKWGWFARQYLHFGEFAACHFPHATISVSHVIQVFCRRAYRRQVVFIPNGANVEVVSGSDRLREFGLEPRRYFLNVSRLVPHKGQHHLIEAFQDAAAADPEGFAGLKLALVGAPSYTPEYELRLKELAAGNPSILFLGYQTGEALRQLYAHAYVYVQPSESEGLPLVVLEAMSFGRPVLVSDIPENLEAMHRAGYAFRNKDPRDLAQKLRELVSRPDDVERAAAQVQGVVEREFNWNVIAEHTEEVYRSVRH